MDGFSQEHTLKTWERFAWAALSAFFTASFLSLLSRFELGAVKASEAVLLRGLTVKLGLWAVFLALFSRVGKRCRWLLSWNYSAAALALSLLPLSFYFPDFNLFFISLLFDLLLLWTIRSAFSRNQPWPLRLLAYLTALPFLLLVPAVLLQGWKEYSLYPPVPPIPPTAGSLIDRFFPLDGEQILLYLLLLVFLAAMAALLTHEALIGRTAGRSTRGRSRAMACLLGGSAAFYHLFFMGRLLIARVRSLSVPSYDFGLFNQMFHYLLRYGRPLTTLERDGLFSHFGVHVSPIYYLFLPVYALFPRPETLQLLQILCVCSGVVPLLLLCRRFSLRPLERGLFAAFYLLQPGLIFSGAYDFHENCFLAPLTIWLFWALLETRYPAILIVSILLLGVKEDAALYLISAAIFLAFYRNWKGGSLASPALKKRLQKERLGLSLALVFLALGIFALQVYYLSTHGDGIMGYRFQAMSQFERLGPPGIPLGFLANPAYYLALLAEAGKLHYLLPLVFSFGLLPFLQHEAEGYLLFIPFVVMNLWSDYPYQSNIFFQYHYGTHAFLVLASLFSYVGFRKKSDNLRCHDFSTLSTYRRAFRQNLALVLLSFGVFSSLCLSQLNFNYQHSLVEIWKNNAPRDTQLREALKTIPREKSIAATTFLTTQLADCDRLYDIDFNPSIAYGRPVDLLLFDQRFIAPWHDAVRQWYEERGYRRSEELSSDWLLVLAKDVGENANGSISSSDRSR